jgi:hypothetical protein
MSLTVVIGPPASGKSTWVKERARVGDVVIDFDRLACALTADGADGHNHAGSVLKVAFATWRAAVDAALQASAHQKVYLIHSLPAEDVLKKYAGWGAEIVTVDPGREVVESRCRKLRPARSFDAVARWYKAIEPPENLETTREW